MFFKAVINQYWFKKKAIFLSYRDISYSILSEQVWLLKQKTGSGVAIEIRLASKRLPVGCRSLSCFGKRRSSTVEKYKVFVAEGKGQISPWSLLKKQIFLGDENFVEEMEAKIDKDRDLTEVPSSQRRAKARALTEYETMYESRNKSILAAYKSGGYTMKTIADHFNLHYSSVSKIIKFSSNS
jgi:hypothetical protein